MRIVWFQVITGLERYGMTMQSIATHLGVSIGTMYNYKFHGVEPRHYVGEELRMLYERHVGLEAPTMRSTDLARPAAGLTVHKMQTSARST